MLRVTVDGVCVQVPEGATILQAARRAGAEVPTLCYMKKINAIGSCRVCMVQVEGREGMAAACNTPAEDGMKVRTNTPAVIEARRQSVRTILASHRSECTTCPRTGTCALQKISADLALDPQPMDADYPLEEWSVGFPLQRDASKCIKCLRCVAECSKVQHCGVWDYFNTGASQRVGVRQGAAIDAAGCSLCGQCVTHCPTGALTERSDIDRVLEALRDPDTVTVVQTAPAVRTSWGEGVGLTRERATQGRMVSALRAIGFDYVFDTDFAADLTIMEEGNEFLEYLKSDRPRPMFTSCCPGWVRFAKQHYPEFVGQLSSAKSPHQMLGAVVKNTFGRVLVEEGKRVFCVSIMPCVAKKYECAVPQLSTKAGPDVDAVLTVREFDRMLRMFGVKCSVLPEDSFDDPLGMSTGAGTIFGRTGGVMEAALRTAAFILTGENPDFSSCDCSRATPDRPWLSKKIDIAGTEVRIAVASGLENASMLLEALKAGEASYDFVEVMACPGGCVGGGGQPIEFNKELASERAQILNTLDGAGTLRMSHENPQIKKLYADYLGEPLSQTAHEWLHTDQETWDI